MRSFINCTPPDTIRMIKSRRICSTHRVLKNAYKILVGISKVKRQLWRLRHRWENNIKMYLKGIVS
jgi:hypothetical protein